ncbi:hypothetical protein EZV62_014648 [Acer yangbiense]|uniref:DUF4283 domain-containing protein n=1 Tax=Acer yangbiense TaxID=1000413 RepID=A0A5C7HTD9_9ROSI|nr:hypothetical protein EZV62_014648 [Acer yangbiense]
MAELEIVKLYENLSLVDEDGEIHEMSEEAQRDGEADVDLCLVGKILSGKKVNREAFKNLIEQLWSPFGSVAIESVGVNIFIIGHASKECFDEKAKIEALKGDSTKLSEKRREMDEEGQLKLRSGSLNSQSSQNHGLRIEGPSAESKLANKKKTVVEGKDYIGSGLIASVLNESEPSPSVRPVNPLIEKVPTEELAMICSTQSEMQTSPKRANTRTWKRLARAMKTENIPHNPSSLFHKLQSVSKKGKMCSKENASSSTSKSKYSVSGIRTRLGKNQKASKFSSKDRDTLSNSLKKWD